MVVNRLIFEYLKANLQPEQNILDFSYRYILQMKFPTTMLVGTTNVSHLEEAIATCNASIDPAIFEHVIQIVREG